MNKINLATSLKNGMSIREISAATGKAYTTIRYWLKVHGLKPAYTNTRTWTDSQLRIAVAGSFCMADVMRKLDLTVRPGNYESLKSAIRRLNLNISHFNRRGVNRKGGTVARPIEELLYLGYNGNASSLKRRLMAVGILKNKCYLCGCKPKWQRKHLVMVLDHKNGNRTDWRRENLRLLCPNCNSQQPTFCRGQSKK